MLTIKTTGLEQYAPGGEARLKLLIIGGPGSGKTRFASFFPRPIWADCEAGLASVADRCVPYTSVNTSVDMLDLLTFLKMECRLPKDKRTYDTVVIDTLDAYQRKLKVEWMEKEKKEAFTGWEAWGFVGQKMQLLLTRLLNLDMNVIVNVHYKDKTTKDDDSGKETHELMLQLQGEVSDTAFNDFDQVGWMGTYWEAASGERIQKRGLTFRATPDKPFLKDRLNVTPRWMEITFADTDYTNLLARVSERMEELKPSELVGEIPSVDPADAVTVQRPEQATSGPLPERVPVELPLSQMDKPSLLKKARESGLVTTVDGAPIRANTTKSELIAAIEQALKAKTPTPDEVAQPSVPVVANPTPAKVPRQTPPTVEQIGQDLVDTATGEVLDPQRGAVATVADVLGGTVVQEEAAPEVAAPPAKPEQACEECGINLADEDQNYVKLAWIKYRRRLCKSHYTARKTG